MSNLTLRQKELIEEFSQLNSWENRYKRLIAIGKELPELPEEKKRDDYKVKGCQSQVWLLARLDDNKKIQFEADSDAMIVRGLVAILLRVYSDATPDEILSTPPDFVKEMGFEANLSPSRANGLISMIRQIMYYATAFRALLASQQA
ncbi:MAG: SufE family protein [Bdellovibrionaceae bacterium]|nr:SufE family protein [Bdellovibrionales bacterium]MCB9083510.1 SufE family protein [Pseudobdellovibrionaceae bacterium]